MDSMKYQMKSNTISKELTKIEAKRNNSINDEAK